MLAAKFLAISHRFCKIVGTSRKFDKMIISFEVVRINNFPGATRRGQQKKKKKTERR